MIKLKIPDATAGNTAKVMKKVKKMLKHWPEHSLNIFQ